MNGLKVFIIALIVFFVTDMLWLGFLAKTLYLKAYGPWLRMENGALKPVWWAALMVYALFGISIITIIMPLSNQHLMYAAGYGALMGFIIYGVYDFTSISIYKDWPIMMSLIDVAWGTFLYGFSAFLTLWIVQKI